MSEKYIVTVYYGAMVTPEDLSSYTALPRALLAVDPNGLISWMEPDVEPAHVQGILKSKAQEKDRVPGREIDHILIELDSSAFILPGFVDTHTHAPQVPNMGSGQQYELLDWLENITFPMESQFKDVTLAKKLYPNIVRRFIDSGTTTCCYYGSLHLDATKALADVVLQLGQRALVGKCNMNRNCPDYYREPSAEASVKSTMELISYIRSLKSDLVHPVLTPRFAISCTDDLLKSLGNIVKVDKDLAIQTHISENKGEIEFTRELFPHCSSYADVYEKHGLLTERTILAHGVHLEDDELSVIKKKGAGVSHCPTSNFNLRSGMARVGEMLDRGIKIGLGTDVSGGFSPSIITAVQHASICSKMVALQSVPSPNAKFAGKQLPIATLLYLATMGGASLCCLEDKIGSLTPGKSFDALIISVDPKERNPGIWCRNEEFTSTNELSTKMLDANLEKFLFGGDDRNIQKVFVQGKCIGGVMHSISGAVPA